MNNDILKVRIPNGYLLVERKGAENEYPGVYISLLKNNDPDGIGDLITCVEYITGDNEIATETYHPDCEEPSHMIIYEDGRDKMY